MNSKRVVVTGMGVFSALGKNIGEFWTNALNGTSAINKIEVEDLNNVKFKNGAQIKNYNPRDFLEQKDCMYYDTFAQYGLIAASEATKHAEVDFSMFPAGKVGVVLGSSIGGQDTHDEAFKTVYYHKRNKVNPLSIPRIMPNAGTSALCMKFGLRGPAYTISSACASGNHAIGNAYQLIKSGVCEAMITGGSETPFSYGFLRAWDALRVISPDTCKPFDLNRKGMILGEGAGILLLENLENAKKRNATIYGEIVGVGMSADAGHITRPDKEGIKLAIEIALNDAEILPEQLSHINAHGTGTQTNDLAEAQVIREIFGDNAKNIPVTATKSLHGHGLGATSAFEAILTVLSLYNSVIPPTANTHEVDPDYEIDLVTDKSRAKQMEFAISNSFAFGGLNSVIVFKMYRE